MNIIPVHEELCKPEKTLLNEEDHELFRILCRKMDLKPSVVQRKLIKAFIAGKPIHNLTPQQFFDIATQK